MTTSLWDKRSISVIFYWRLVCRMLPHFLLLCHVTFSARFQPLRTPDDVNLYKSTISALQYVCITRLHIHFTVHKLNQLMQHPYLRHRKVVLWIMRYLKGTIDYGLWFRLNHVPSSTVTFLCWCWLGKWLSWQKVCIWSLSSVKQQSYCLEFQKISMLSLVPLLKLNIELSLMFFVKYFG